MNPNNPTPFKRNIHEDMGDEEYMEHTLQGWLTAETASIEDLYYRARSFAGGNESLINASPDEQLAAHMDSMYGEGWERVRVSDPAEAGRECYAIMIPPEPSQLAEQ